MNDISVVSFVTKFNGTILVKITCTASVIKDEDYRLKWLIH